MRRLIEPLGITTPIGCFNGGVIAAADLSVISEHLLSPDIARRSLELLDAEGARPWVFAGQDWLARHSDGPYIGREERTVGFRPTVVADFGPFLNTTAKIVGVSADFERLAQCERDVRAALGRSGDRGALAALLPRYYAFAGQQGRGAIGYREIVGGSAGGDRGHRRRPQRCRDVQAQWSQHCHGQCQPGGAAGGGLRDGQQSRRWLRHTRSIGSSSAASDRTRRLRCARAAGRA